MNINTTKLLQTQIRFISIVKKVLLSTRGGVDPIVNFAYLM